MTQSGLTSTEGLSSDQLDRLKKIAVKLRIQVIEMLAAAGSGHPASALGLADIFATLYFHLLKHDPNNPQSPDRDYFLVSNGHICPIWYAALAESGYFDSAELTSLRQINSRLQGHPHLGSIPGVENTSGSLGQGLSQACGLALALKMDQRLNRVFCLISDAEPEEGQTLEALMLARKYQLDNLILLIDRNFIQIEGNTGDIMPLEPYRQRLLTFGWHVFEIDGHNPQAFVEAVNQAQTIKNTPVAIICRTTPGKGVSFMENNYQWHGQLPTPEEAARAIAELKTRLT